MTQTGFERLFLLDRLGFVKYAMRYGYSLTPVYAYGENDLYTTVNVASSLRDWLARYKIPIVLFYGDAKLPILPRRNESGLTLVVGERVSVKHVAQPTLQELRRAHGEYVEKVTELYYRYNHDSDRPLEVV
jgi:2-acylglycerol O-acyltransferase 2